jgi:FkbM family methyltransferase
MIDYSIVFEGQTEDFRKIHYSVQSKEEKKVVFKIYNLYLEHVEYISSMTLSPGFSFWTYFPTNSQNRVIIFYDEPTSEIVGLFGLKGNFDFKDKDNNSFVKKLLPKLTEGQKHNVAVVMNELFCHGTYDNEFISVEQGDFVVDIGFNFGLFSLQALSKNVSKIIAFEPNTSITQHFKEMINDKRVNINDFAVSNYHGEVIFYENSDPGLSTIYQEKDLIESKSGQYSVKVINFQDYLTENKIEKIDYLKIDCEGAEYDIIDSLDEQYLSNNIRKICIEYHNHLHDDRVKKMINKISDCGFQIQLPTSPDSPIGMLRAKKL